MSIDHEYTKNIVCPYCGHEDKDSFEVEPDNEDLGLLECDDCGKHFYATRSITIDYCTEKATYGTCKHCGKENVPVEDYHSSCGSYEGLCTACGYKETRRLQIEYMRNMYKEGDND